MRADALPARPSPATCEQSAGQMMKNHRSILSFFLLPFHGARSAAEQDLQISGNLQVFEVFKSGSRALSVTEQFLQS